MTTPSTILSSEDTKSAKSLLEQISSGATSAETASKRCQQTLRDVQRLLDPDSLTQFKFKKRKPSHLFHGTGQDIQAKSPTLSPFAKMVFDTTSVSYRYLTPESPDPEPKKTPNGVMPESHAKAVEVGVNGHVTTQQHQPTPSSQQRKVEAVIPSTLTPSQRAEYQYMSDLTSSKRRDATIASGSRAISVDQRQKGDLAVQNLQNLLLDVFEAEDQLQSGVSEFGPEHASAIFATHADGDGSMPRLQSDIQAKLESCIYKVVSNGRLYDVEVENLIRIQRLCEGPVAGVEKIPLRIGEDWSEQDVEEWLLNLGAAESGLVAARALMRIMSGGAQLKELQSEDSLRETLEALKAVIEGCIVPIVQEPPLSGEKIRGEKTQPPPNPKFVLASSNRNAVVSLMNAASKGMRLLGDLLVKTDFDGTSISSVEYLCKTLIFAENASTEKDSAVGVQNFETMRRCAMDVLSKIFTKYTEQRQFIFDEILVSLEKLPATKQSARQYRLTDAKPIQLVSALLMRLVQTSATKSNEALKLRSKVQDDEDEGGDDASDEASEDEASSDDEDTIKISPSKPQGSSQDLASIANPLHEAARSNAWYIVKVLTHRAATTSKTSEEPYRKLLDIFTEDFINVLGSSEWPAAELLLRTLTMNMIRIIDGEKSSVPSRTLALELLGTMGSGILNLHAAARAACRSVDTNDSHIARHLCNLVTQLEAGQNETLDLLAFEGPYRYVIQFLEARNTGEDAQLQTARGYHLMEWAHCVVGGRDGSTDSDASDTPRGSKELQAKLKHMFAHPKWLDDQAGFALPTTAESRLASIVLTLNSTFCRAFDRVFKTLLNSMSSEQTRVKSRSLSSVISLLEKDVSILDRNSSVLNYIFRCATDSSPLVRDSALNLIDKCISLRPELDATIYNRVIERTRDAATSVRKRAMKMLKDMYLRKNSNDIRSAIADAIISRIADTEESVTELARSTMEEIWFQPFYGQHLDGDRAIEAKLAFSSQAALLIETIERNDDVSPVLESLTRRSLNKSKAAATNARVCKTIISVLFDGVIDSSEIPGSPPQDSILRGLTIFARASAELFTTSQLERLEPYTKNLTNTDDLDVYRSVITILRNVMPYQPTMNPDTLNKLQSTLLQSVTKLQKPELREVAPCLWTIDRMLGELGNPDRVPNFMISVLQKIFQMSSGDSALDEKVVATFGKLMRIAGEFGNAYDFDSHLTNFQQRCTWYSGDSIAGLIVETLCPFTSPKYPLPIRVAALEAICTVSQAWPKQFLRSDVTNAVEMVFRDKVPSLVEVLLDGLEGFFKAQEVPDETEDGPELGSGVASGTERLGKTYVASDHDGASTALAQRFLSQFLHLALDSCDEAAFISARLVVSINKQGLVHPKQSAPALVALETCPNKTVASEAFKEHKSQHQKHESLFEKEYMRAVQQTLEYQQNVIGDAAGHTGSPPASKMHLTWEVLKNGKAQIRKKFLGNMAQKLDFDQSKLDVTSSVPQHVFFVRFCLENLAFFEYDKVDDLLHLTSSLEKIFAGTGSAVAQAIESEVLKLQVDAVVSSENTEIVGTSETLVAESVQSNVDINRLQQLALSAQILCLIWETRSFLNRLWNLQKHAAKSKQPAKDSNRAPNRATHASSLTDVYVKRIEEIAARIHSEETARSMCSAFVELISIDHEVKVGSDEDAEADMNGYATPSESTERKSPSLPPSGGGRGRKRKSSMVNTTPRKRGRPSLGKRRSTSGKYTEDDDDDDDGGWD